MATFEFKGKTFYIDGRLKRQLDNKIIPDLKKRDKDCVFIIEGKERTGKTKFSDILAAYIASELRTEYNLSNVCMSPQEFRNKIMSAKKRQPVIYDEAHRGMASARALSEINNILKDLMMEMGQKNLLVLINLPTFFLLDKYAALFRARGVFHIYEKKGRRGFWVFFNERNKLTLYMKGKKEFNYNCMKWPRFRGRFYNQYAIDEQEYRKKKALSFKKRPRITRAETYKAQRDSLFWYMNKKLDINQTKIAEISEEMDIVIKRNTISEIIAERDRELARKKGEKEQKSD